MYPCTWDSQHHVFCPEGSFLTKEAMVKDVGNPVRVQLPVTRARKTLWHPARERHELGEVGGSPCPLAEPGAQPSHTGRCTEWEGKPAQETQTCPVVWLQRRTLPSSPCCQQSICALGYMVFRKGDILWSRNSDIALLGCTP